MLQIDCMKTLILIIACLITARSSFSYPISPRPLRKLIIKSELIIIGKVIYTSNPDDKKEIDQDTDYALIFIQECLQGKRLPDTIKVYYNANTICPAPPEYKKGDRIIAFLAKNKGENSYHNPAHSYGVKSFSSEEQRNVYRTRILEMQDILAKKKPSQKHTAIIDWLVKCAAHPVTRWEGIYELSHQGDVMSSYDDDRSMKKSVFLSAPQKQLLYDSFIQIQKPTYEDLYLVDIASGVNDAMLLNQLKQKLTEADPDNEWLLALMMTYIVKLTDNKELEDILKKATEILYNSSNKQTKTFGELYKAFLEKMQNSSLKQTGSTAVIHTS